jgi:2-oxoacid:acceptor oxidoreductase gamma subunit (pyruvate/2-ketoisovalerate family)
MKEIRWHARAGQGAKTAAQLLAVALLREGKSVQAFPEYGPERRGSPMRAYTRYDDRPIRRRDSIEEPDAVVVLEPSLAHGADAAAGLRPGGLLLVNSEEPIAGAVCVPADRIEPKAINLVMLGALAACLGEPSLEGLAAAAAEVLGRKADPEKLAAALEAGHRSAREERCAA